MSNSSLSSTVSLFNSSSSSSSSSITNVTSAPSESLMDEPSRSFVQRHANQLTVGLVVGIVGSMLFSLFIYYIVVKAKRAKLRATQGDHDGERGHVTDSWNSSSQLEPQQEPPQTTSIQRPPPSPHQLQATHGGRTHTHASSAAATPAG